MFEIHDDFLNEKDFENIKSVIMSDNFPWFYREGKVNPNDGLPALTHCFYDNNFVNSDKYDLLVPIMDKCRMTSILKIKANLDYKRDDIFKTTLHSDCTPPLKGFKTGIFYLDDSNGKTYFENGQVVDSVSNRFVQFPQEIKHGTQIQTDKNRRIIINFNWF
tara:strand:+ start:99 stop:584 length:486 start_codon:yes stop_codon:yes gene_type:complete